jgi:phosphate transport system substrate-binding protein
MVNTEGKTVAPKIKTFQAAGANADWKNAPGFYMVLTNQPGEESWPITGVTYILIYKKQNDLKNIKAMFDYFSWCYEQGAKYATALNYVPIPENVVKMVKKEWKKVECNGDSVL